MGHCKAFVGATAAIVVSVLIAGCSFGPRPGA